MKNKPDQGQLGQGEVGHGASFLSSSEPASRTLDGSAWREVWSVPKAGPGDVLQEETDTLYRGFSKIKLHLAINCFNNIRVGSSQESEFACILGVVPNFIPWSPNH